MSQFKFQSNHIPLNKNVSFREFTNKLVKQARAKGGFEKLAAKGEQHSDDNSNEDYRDEKGKVPGEQNTGPDEREKDDNGTSKEDKDKYLTDGQKKLPDALQKAIIKKKKSKDGDDDKKKSKGKDMKSCGTSMKGMGSCAEVAEIPIKIAKDGTITLLNKQAEDKSNSEEADSSGQLEVEPLHQDSGDSESTHSGDLDPKNKNVGHAKNDSSSDAKNKKEKEEDDDDNKKESSLDAALEKFAKMNNQTKTMLREYYKQYYPADYVEALLAEK